MKKKRNKYNVFTVGKHRKRSRMSYHNNKNTALAFFKSNIYVKPKFI